jgi:hypothetical protein
MCFLPSGPVGSEYAPHKLIAGALCEAVVQKSSIWLFRTITVATALLIAGNPDKPRSFGAVHVEWRLPWAFGVVATDQCRATEA